MVVKTKDSPGCLGVNPESASYGLCVNIGQKNFSFSLPMSPFPYLLNGDKYTESIPSMLSKLNDSIHVKCLKPNLAHDDATYVVLSLFLVL